jgi:DnaK suppressor protein
MRRERQHPTALRRRAVAMATKLAQQRLKQLREALVAKRRQLETEVGRSAIYEKGLDEDATKDLGDQANTAYTREFQFELGNGDRRLLREVMTALQKLDEGGFGECERCGEPIGEKRLDALPFARYCIECQRRLEREDKAPAG